MDMKLYDKDLTFVAGLFIRKQFKFFTTFLPNKCSHIITKAGNAPYCMENWFFAMWQLIDIMNDLAKKKYDFCKKKTTTSSSEVFVLFLKN